jgi:hypothetical protein
MSNDLTRAVTVGKILARLKISSYKHLLSMEHLTKEDLPGTHLQDGLLNFAMTFKPQVSAGWPTGGA